MNAPIPQVLAVEDNETLAALMQRILLREAVELTLAGSGEQALELVRQRRFDLIILNIRLPGMNGLEFCRQLKLDPALKDIPVLFASGETSPEFVDAAFRLGAADYLPKPYGVDEFRARVLALLRRSAPAG